MVAVEGAVVLFGGQISLSQDHPSPQILEIEEYRLTYHQLPNGGESSPLTGVVALAIAVAGAVVGFWRWGTSFFQARRLVRAATPVGEPDLLMASGAIADRIGLACLPRILQSDQISSPITTGLIRPVVVLPLHSSQGDFEDFGLMMLHELIHVRRHDTLWWATVSLMASLLWFHPLARWVARAARLERERATDEEVVGTIGNSCAYSDFLVRAVVGRNVEIAVGLSGGGKTDIESRIEWINRFGMAPRTAVFEPSWVAVSIVSIGLLGTAVVLPPQQTEGQGKGGFVDIERVSESRTDAGNRTPVRVDLVDGRMRVTPID